MNYIEIFAGKNEKITSNLVKYFTGDLKNFLLISKKGDKEKFLEILGKINNLPENLRNINYQDENGFSALHYSSDEGNLKIVDILLESNCEINIKNSFDQTPLHLSSKRGYFDISKKLLDGGALLNAFDKEKNSPIHYVCENNHIELLNFFLKYILYGGFLLYLLKFE